MMYVIILFLIFFGLFIWSATELRKQVKKDWETLDYLKNKSFTVSTKQEIEEFHKEFIEKASKIHNRHILIELHQIDGYLRGMYKQYKTKQQ